METKLSPIEKRQKFRQDKIRHEQAGYLIPGLGGPEEIIGGLENPYLLRWHLVPQNENFNVYLHCFKRPDDDRALHDHPWPSISIIIRGRYVEVLPDLLAAATPYSLIYHLPVIRKTRSMLSVVPRMATSPHRVELPDGDCWSLFLTGRKVREWGFHCKEGWLHNVEYERLYGARV